MLCKSENSLLRSKEKYLEIFHEKVKQKCIDQVSINGLNYQIKSTHCGGKNRKNIMKLKSQKIGDIKIFTKKPSYLPSWSFFLSFRSLEGKQQIISKTYQNKAVFPDKLTYWRYNIIA